MDWEVTPPQSRLCNPGRPITPETSAIHHLIDSDVAEAPNWKSVLGGLLRLNPEKPLAYAAHGMNFEAKWLHPDWLGTTPLICVYKAALRLWKESPSHSNQVLRYWRKPTGLNRDLATPAHRAGPDAYVTALNLRDMLNGGCHYEEMAAWTKVPALTIRCRLGEYRKNGEGTLWEEVETSFLRWILSKQSFDEDTVFTVKHHLELREQEAKFAAERAALNAQFRANDMAETPFE